MAATAPILIHTPSDGLAPSTPEPRRGTGPLWLCAHFPDLALEALQLDPGQPLAVTKEHKGRPCVQAASGPAHQAGVDAGMTLAAALALCPDLRVECRDPAAEQAALRRMAEAGLDFTPWVSLDQAPSLLLEIRASLNLFGGAEPLRERLRQALRALGHRAVIAITPAAEASGLLARFGVEVIVQDRQALRSALGPLPLAALPLNEKTARRILRTGVRQFADLWRLPRDGLARRYGPDLVRRLDELTGKQTQVLSAFHRPPVFMARRDLPIALERLDHFFPAIAHMAEEFAVFLKARDAAALGVTLDLSHPGRPATRIELSFRSGNRDAAHGLALLREKLERSPLPAPVIAVAWLSSAIVPFAPECTDLFDDASARSGSGRDWQAVLEQLEIRLGHGAVQRLGSRDDHRPERATAVDSGASFPPPPLPARPLWLLSAPQCLDAQDLRLLSEAERIESGWWDGAAIRRDYRVALDRQGRKLWVFRDLKASDRWYLHGLFG